MKKTLLIASILSLFLSSFAACDSKEPSSVDTSRIETSINIEERETKIPAADSAGKDSTTTNPVETIPAKPAKTASEGLEFTSYDDGIWYVTGIGTCTDTDIVIPSMHNGESVIGIGENAFEECTSLTSVTFAENSQLTTIDNAAFSQCTSLTSIELPDSVTTISGGAFKGCTNLKTVYYEGTLEQWCKMAFIGGYTNPCNNGAVLYIGGTLADDIIIPSTVTEITEYAFEGCTSLTSIEIPDSVSTIGRDAFIDCTSLTSITISDGVMSIGTNAFWGCSSLKSIEIPDGVTTIEVGIFAECTNLTRVEIPDSVTFIKHGVFMGCPSLISINIPDSVPSIGNFTFSGCTSLTSINIPSSVTYIGAAAFINCTGLNTIAFEGTVDQWNAITKDTNWNLYVPATEVICSDGTVALQ